MAATVGAVAVGVTAGVVAAPAALAAPPGGLPCSSPGNLTAFLTCGAAYTSSGSVSLGDLGWAPGTPITIRSVGGAGGAAADTTHGGSPGQVTSTWTPTSLRGGISWTLGGNGQNGVLRAGGAGGAGGLPGGTGSGGAGGSGSTGDASARAGGGGGGGGGATAVYVASGTTPTASSQNLLQVSPGAGGAADLQGYGGDVSQNGAGAIQGGYVCQGGLAGTATANGVGTCGGGNGSAASGGAGFRGDSPGSGTGYGVIVGGAGPIDGGGGGGGGLTGGAGGGDTFWQYQSALQNGGTGGGGGYGTAIDAGTTQMFTSARVILSWQIPAQTRTTLSLSQSVTSTTHPIIATATGFSTAPFSVEGISAYVQFYVDGIPYGAKTNVDWYSEAASTSLTLPAGIHTVTATFTPTGATADFASSTSAPVTVTVNPSRWDHVTRSDDGNWTPVGDAGVAAQIPGTIVSAAAAATGNGVAQYVTATSDGRVWHTSRNADGSWSAAPDDVAAAAHIPGTVTNVAGSASAAGESQYLVVTSDGRLWHTIRHADGSWDPAGDAAAAAHIPGTVINAAVTSVLGSSDMQFLVVTSNGKVWHTIRHADTTWDPAADAAGAAHVTSPVISVAATSNHAHGSQFLFLTDDGHAWYATRQVNGSWTPAIDASAAANIPGAAVAAAESWTVTDNTEFMIVTADGQAWHTIRHPDGSWDPANSATTTLGLTPTAVSATAICTTSGEIQYTVATD